jgi:ribosomal protein S19E (S16A)
MRQKVGVNTLRKHYGVNQRNGTNTEHTRMAAGKNIRYCLIQLQAAGLVGTVRFETDEGGSHLMGKCLTKKGTTDMDRIASQIIKELKKQ